MVSITWKKVTGSVSIPFDERGSKRRNSSASCKRSSRAGGSRRPASISSEAAALTAAARAITLLSPARSAELATSVSIGLRLPNPGRRQISGDSQFPVDLLDRLAAGLKPEEIIDESGHQEPAAEIDERQRDFRQRYIGLEVIVGPDAQREPNRTDDLADAAEAIGRAHAGGAQVRRPDFGRVGPEAGETAMGEEERDRQDQPERRHPEPHHVVIVAGHHGQDAGAEAKTGAPAPPGRTPI